jgi:hypothetical protein
MRVEERSYRYSSSVSQPTLYASAYACLTLSLTGEVDQLDEEDRGLWVTYFDAHQSASDGLFRDSAIQNKIFDNTDWWGARHLAMHMISAYTALGAKPPYRFAFLDEYKDMKTLHGWLSSHRWQQPLADGDDIDNKIMNIACLLQYDRDFFDDRKAGEAVRFISDYLIDRVDRKTGMWNVFDETKPDEVSRAVQFAYHINKILFYDDVPLVNEKSVIDLTLSTQNRFGGFGVPENSSACEDIDSIDMLVYLANRTTYKHDEIHNALQRGLAWVLANQNEDGGFVFRRNEPLVYGHPLMRSSSNESALFPTWFRTLTVAYLVNFLYKDNGFSFIRSPGCQF